MAYTRILLITPSFVKDATTIHSNLDNGLLVPIIEDCQAFYVEPITGTKLLEEIKAEIDAGSISADNTTLLNDYLIKGMLRWIVGKSLRGNSYKKTNKGTVTMSGDNATTASDKELIEQFNDCMRSADSYAQRATLFLMENATTYPLYCDNDKLNEMNPDGRTFRIGINLD